MSSQSNGEVFTTECLAFFDFANHGLFTNDKERGREFFEIIYFRIINFNN